MSVKKAIVTRLGAIGDLVQITPLLKLLKEDGYHVTLHAKKNAQDMLRLDPNIDRFFVHDESVPISGLDEYLEKLYKDYDKVVNLSGVIEEGLLPLEGSDNYKLSHDERHSRFNKNYFDAILEKGGYKVIGLLPELYFSPTERMEASRYIGKFKNKFVVLWALSGSAHHKAWPFTEESMKFWYQAHPDTMFITVGDDFCVMFETDKASYIVPKSGVWHIRKSMLMTKYVDLVIAPETGILSAAGAYDTPKIALLSHSSVENLTKYFKRCINIYADVACYPCHQLHYTLTSCDLVHEFPSPVCMAKISPATLLNHMEDVYQDWKVKNGTHSRVERQNILCA